MCRNGVLELIYLLVRGHKGDNTIVEASCRVGRKRGRVWFLGGVRKTPEKESD